MSSKPFRRLMIVGTSALTLVAAVTPAAYAGDDDGDDPEAPIEQPAPEQSVTQDTSSSDTSSSGSGGGSSADTQVAKGGVQTGAGGMASIDEPTVMVPLTLAGTGLILLMSAGAGGLALSRRS
jgi:hypothetical protein